MTKHLLTALLIAGFSVAAKAEPTVYYCNTTEYAQVTGGGVIDVKSYPFKLFVDKAKVKISGDIDPIEITSGADGTVLPMSLSKDGNDDFLAFNYKAVLDFRNRQLAYTTVRRRAIDGDFLLSSLLADCDKF